MPVSSNFTLACLPDRIANSYSSITSGSEAITDQNVKTKVLSERWRSGVSSATKSWLQVQFTNYFPDIQSVAIVGTNFSPSGLWRIRMDGTSAPSSLWESLPPTNVESSNNATANDGVSAPTHTEVDEGYDSADGNGIRISAGAGVRDVLLSFGTPATTPVTGSAVQEFRIKMGLQAAGDSGSVTVALYESGSPVSGASWTVQSADISTTLSEYVFQWDAADLGTASGANVEIYIRYTSASGPDLLIDTVDWNTYPTGDGGVDYDSGILSAFDTFSSQSLGDAALSDIATGINWTHAHICPSEQTSVKYMLIETWDRDLSSRIEPSIRLSGYHYAWDNTEVGLLLAGPVYVPSRNVDIGWSVGVIDNSTITETDQGSTFVRRGFRKRWVEATFNHLDHDESMQNLFLWLDMNLGSGAGVVVVPEPNNAGVQTLQNIYARLDSSGAFSTEERARMNHTVRFKEW